MRYLHNLVLYHAVTPLHVGVGSDVGVVDLPVFRERTTGFPAIPGSGIRGSLRAAFPDEIDVDGDLAELLGRQRLTFAREKLFGKAPAGGMGDEVAPEAEDLPGAGSVAVHDSKVLLFPVRSDRRVFVWITCPAALRRLRTEAEVFLGVQADDSAWRIDLRGEYGAGSFDEQFLAVTSDAGGWATESLHLEEFQFSPGPDSEELRADRHLLQRLTERLGAILGLDGLVGNTVLVSDRTFHHFVNHATLVLQHNRLDAQKTVARGQLFSLEAVPPETIFFGWMGATEGRWREPRDVEGGGEEEGVRPSRATIRGLLRSGLLGDGTGLPALHLGGQESTGLGVTRLAWVDEGEGEA